MPIKEIKEFVDWSMEGDSTIDQRLELIKEQQEVVRLQIEAIQENLKILNYKRWYYETAKQAGTCDVHKTMKPEDIPEEFREIALHNKKRISLRWKGREKAMKENPYDNELFSRNTARCSDPEKD